MNDRLTAASRVPLLRHVVSAMAIAVAVLVLVTAMRPSPNDFLALLPRPGLSPEQVVRIQIGALSTNSQRDEGIAVAFRFASPDNRTKTGPIARFASMIRSDDYLPLLDSLSVEYGRTMTRDGRSYTAILVTDRRGVSSAFVWVLAKQQSGVFADCWMTDSVIPVGDLQTLRFA